MKTTTRGKFVVLLRGVNGGKGNRTENFFPEELQQQVERQINGFSHHAQRL